MKALGYLSLVAAAAVVLMAAGILQEKRKQPKDTSRFELLGSADIFRFRSIYCEPAECRLN